MECLELHNKPKAEVHLEHLLTGPKKRSRRRTRRRRRRRRKRRRRRRRRRRRGEGRGYALVRSVLRSQQRIATVTICNQSIQITKSYVSWNVGGHQ
jgi:hypothetical protein